MRIRILEVLSTLQPAGAENVVLSLASGFDRSRFDPAVVSLYDAFPNGLEPLLEQRGVPLWHLGKHPGPDLRMYARLRHLVREFRPHVIHSHCSVMRYIVHLSASVVAHTVHNMAKQEVDAFGRLVHRYGFRRGIVPIAVGAAVADSFRQIYGFPPAATIPNGIDTDCFWRPEARREWRRANGFRDDELLIVSIGRLEPQKNPVALANAISRIPNVRLLLAGQGSLRPRLEGRERVHLLGLRSDIPDILAAADIFALTSSWEGLPLAVIEAMAAGLPVVATQVGSVQEVVEHGRTGLLVSVGDEEGLVKALQRLAQDTECRKRMGAAARIRAQLFSVRGMVNAYEHLFASLLEQTRGAIQYRGTAAASIL